MHRNKIANMSPVCVQYGTALYENYQAAKKRASSLQTVYFAARKGESTYKKDLGKVLIIIITNNMSLDM